MHEASVALLSQLTIACLQVELKAAQESNTSAEERLRKAEKLAKREGLKAAAMKTMLEEHSSKAEEHGAAREEVSTMHAAMSPSFHRTNQWRCHKSRVRLW